MFKDQARDLEEDLALCELAQADKGAAIGLMIQAPEGWPYAIRRALELEVENDRLREEISLMQEQVQQHRSLCYD